jgi:cysteine synthase
MQYVPRPPSASWTTQDRIHRMSAGISSSPTCFERPAASARPEGIFAGVSTGANVVGSLRLAERLGPGAVIVTPAVDSGFKYLSVSPYADT